MNGCLPGRKDFMTLQQTRIIGQEEGKEYKCGMTNIFMVAPEECF
jgi:hypothetical protein